MKLAVDIAPNLPKFVRDVVDRAAQIETHPERFPELTGAAFVAPGTKLRRRRASRLHAIALTVAALGRRLDRRTLRVGMQADNGLCWGVAVDVLCRDTGLSRSRQVRALAEINAARYGSSRQPVERLAEPRPRPGRRPGTRGAMQTHRGLPAVRTLSPLLLRRLGFTDAKVARARQHAADAWKARVGPSLSAAALLGSRAALRRLAAPAKPTVEAPRHPEIELAVRARHPDWSRERVIALARSLTRPPPST